MAAELFVGWHWRRDFRRIHGGRPAGGAKHSDRGGEPENGREDHQRKERRGALEHCQGHERGQRGQGVGGEDRRSGKGKRFPGRRSIPKDDFGAGGEVFRRAENQRGQGRGEPADGAGRNAERARRGGRHCEAVRRRDADKGGAQDGGRKPVRNPGDAGNAGHGDRPGRSMGQPKLCGQPAGNGKDHGKRAGTDQWREQGRSGGKGFHGGGQGRDGGAEVAICRGGGKKRRTDGHWRCARENHRH